MENTLFVEGHPRTKGSWTAMNVKGVTRFRHASSNSARWCRYLKNEVTKRWQHDPLVSGPLHLTLKFSVPRPKTVRSVHPTSRFSGDVDKLARAVLDTLTGVVYHDDSQVVALTAVKCFGDPAGVLITYKETAA